MVMVMVAAVGLKADSVGGLHPAGSEVVCVVDGCRNHHGFHGAHRHASCPGNVVFGRAGVSRVADARVDTRGVVVRTATLDAGGAVSDESSYKFFWNPICAKD